MIQCADDDCQSLHDLKSDFAELRKDWRADNSRLLARMSFLGVLTAAVITAATQWQIARLNKVPIPAQPSPYVFATR